MSRDVEQPAAIAVALATGRGELMNVAIGQIERGEVKLSTAQIVDLLYLIMAQRYEISHQKALIFDAHELLASLDGRVESWDRAMREAKKDIAEVIGGQEG